jgi:hypothetical protein
VNADTTNLIERPYQEIVDDILTSLVGGVVNEPIVFDVKSVLYPLAQPADDIRSVTGTIQSPDQEAEAHHVFLKEVDFLFNADKNAVVWQDGGAKPKDETKFYVDYFRPPGARPSPLADINVGSVTRTIGEAISREIATVYDQINLAYKSGFIDTAKGKSLDFVVSILGITRKTKQFAVGLETFFRDPAVEGNIAIAPGTELATDKAEALFETTEPRTLQRGQDRIDVPIRAGIKFAGEKGKVEAGKINTLSQLVAGIARVTNFEATILAAEDESDEELRLRAKAVLRGLGKATIAALIRVVIENRAKLEEISDPNTPGAKQTDPGKVTMLVDIEAPRFPGLAAAIHDTRAAGVQATIAARFVFVKFKIVAKITPGISADGKIKIAEEMIASLQQYIDGLGAGKPAPGKDLLKAIKKVKDVIDAKIVDVRPSRADIGKPGLDPLTEALVSEIANVNTTDTEALRGAISEVLKADSIGLAPTARRDPDRSVVRAVDADGKSTSGQAKDGEIEAGKFEIVPGEGFSLVLDMEPADIVLQES